jgi:hypothetical protein
LTVATLRESQFTLTRADETRLDDIELVLDKHETRHLLNILDGAERLEQQDWERWEGARELHELVKRAALDTGWGIDEAGRQFGCRLITHDPWHSVIPNRAVLEGIEQIIKGTAGEWPMQQPASDAPEAMVAAIRALLDEHNKRGALNCPRSSDRSTTTASLT